LSRFIALLVATADASAGSRLDQLGRLLEGAPAEGQFWAPYCHARAEQALWAGDPDGALIQARRGLDASDDSTFSWYSMQLYRVAARAAADVAERARARRDEEAVSAVRAVWDGIEATYRPFLATVHERYRGKAAAEARAEASTIEAEIARMDRAPQVEVWRDALALWRQRERPYLVAYVQWRLGEALLQAGDRIAAAEALREADRIALALGAVPLRNEVAGLAARARVVLTVADHAGARGPGAAAEPEPDDPFGLTPREREVLALVSTGRTNRQIATALFISESTAGVHVSNILGKLGVSTRTEAAGIAVRLGLGASALSAAD
jgi:DNA-binding NarL/FixJ family response regulator